jgi:hypothetical protein
MLRADQLLVDRWTVHKITRVEHPLPQKTVTVELANQITGAKSTRNLRWDEQLTTEEPLEVKIGETAKIRVELALLADEENRPAYRYRVTDDSAGIDYEATDLRLGVNHRPDNAKAAKSLLSFLGATSEAFLVGHDLEADAFPEEVNFWAQQHGDEITLAELTLSNGRGSMADSSVRVSLLNGKGCIPCGVPPEVIATDDDHVAKIDAALDHLTIVYEVDIWQLHVNVRPVCNS